MDFRGFLIFLLYYESLIYKTIIKMKVYNKNEVKNIALIGGAKSGKTTLAEAMLFSGGVISRRGTVEDKNTVSDYRPIEMERQSSISSTVLYSEQNGRKLNFIDVPGFDDFVGEVVTALRPAGTAVNVVNAQNGVEVGTEIAWRQTKKANKPMVFAINHLDHENSNFDEVISQMRIQFGKPGLTIIQYPINAGPGFNAYIDLLQQKLYTFNDDTDNPVITDIPAEHQEKAAILFNELVENAAENDDSLMETFFDKGTLTEDEIRKGLALGLLHRSVFPVICINAKANFGIKRMIQFLLNNVPSPADMAPVKLTNGEEVDMNSNEPMAFVFKTSIEEHIGEINFFKVYSGEISEGMEVMNTNTNTKERINQLYVVSGKKREKVEKVCAGDIGATVKLKNTSTNDTLTSLKDGESKITPVIFPDPKFRVAVKAENSSDDEKMATSLYNMAKYDKTIKVGYSKELRQHILEGQGELQLNLIKKMIEDEEKIKLVFYTPKVPYRETITKKASASYRHKKQSGGSGQFGEVHMVIQPYFEGYKDPTDFPVRGTEEHKLPWGGKLIFNNCIVGGAIDARFLPAILKGIMEKLDQGPLTGSYARDIVVYIHDGKMHPVDSNEISFKLAGRHAFKEAFKNAGPKILEPIYNVEVLMPEEKMGDVMTDLQGRRAIIMGMEAEGNYQKIKAKVPMAEMNRYSTTLSSICSGRAMFSMTYDSYAQVPGDVQEKLLKDYAEITEDED